MFRGVPIFGIIATANMAASAAEPQVHPGITHLETFLAAVGILVRGLDGTQVFAVCAHDMPRRIAPR
jgi:hypothetical protein